MEIEVAAALLDASRRLTSKEVLTGSEQNLPAQEVNQNIRDIPSTLMKPCLFERIMKEI